MREVTPAEVAAQLRRFRFGVVASEFNDEAAPGIVAAMRAAAPVGKHPKPGAPRMADSWRYHRASSTESSVLTVANTAPQTRFVLHGTAAHEIHPKGDHPLAFFWDKVNAVVASFGWHGARYGYVEHPGTTANRFNRRAWLGVREEVGAALGRKAAKELIR